MAISCNLEVPRQNKQSNFHFFQIQMKQTNNAIKFLMAQYRAIFQNAYFKGLATAAVVTMGLTIIRHNINIDVSCDIF